MQDNELPELLPHVVVESLSKHAFVLGYSIRSVTLAYYVGMDEVVTAIKQSDILWERGAGTPNE